jgi:hypothetical protein
VETDEGPVILTPGSIRMENGSIIIDILEDDDEVNEHQVEIGENEADELEEPEDEVNGESILGIEEAEDWERAEELGAEELED